jgi:DNA-binding NarL/FixJ family response regulator
MFSQPKPIDTTRQAAIIRLNAVGLTKAKIANQVGVCESTVYRVLAKARKA